MTLAAVVRPGIWSTVLRARCNEIDQRELSYVCQLMHGGRLQLPDCRVCVTDVAPLLSATSTTLLKKSLKSLRVKSEEALLMHGGALSLNSC